MRASARKKKRENPRFFRDLKSNPRFLWFWEEKQGLSTVLWFQNGIFQLAQQMSEN